MLKSKCCNEEEEKEIKEVESQRDLIKKLNKTIEEQIQKINALKNRDILPYLKKLVSLIEE